MRATWLADVLRDAGLTIRPYDGWETRGADTFSPRGIILHHTVTRPTAQDAAVDRLLATYGNSTTPPPLANYSTNRDGSVSIIAAGTANHGGKGNWKGIAGNRFFFGDEMKNYGTAEREPWIPGQVESARRAAAAILKHINRDVSWVCSHAEYALPPGRKTDPHSLKMTEQRALIAALDRPEEDMLNVNPGDKGAVPEYWQRIMRAIDPSFTPTNYQEWNAAAVAELQKLTGPGDNIGPGEAAALHTLLAAQGGGTVDSVARAGVTKLEQTFSRVRSVL